MHIGVENGWYDLDNLLEAHIYSFFLSVILFVLSDLFFVLFLSRGSSTSWTHTATESTILQNVRTKTRFCPMVFPTTCSSTRKIMEFSISRYLASSLCFILLANFQIRVVPEHIQTVRELY